MAAQGGFGMISYTISHLTPIDLPPSVCAIGYFDGLHRGHQKLIETAKEQAQKRGVALSVLTFHPDPWAVLKPDAPLEHLVNLEEKKQILEALGVDLFYIVDFTKEFAALSIEAFHQFLKALHIEALVCGFDFHYGAKGKGNPQSLLQCDYFETTVISKISDEESQDEKEIAKISSSRIEKLILEGKVQKANALLGYLYSISGEVVHGFKRGHSLGFPTANLKVDAETLVPGSGVYAGFVAIDHTLFAAMINVGKNPTFDNKALSIEAYILNQHLDLYGQTVRFFFVKKLRGEKKFASFEDLKAQLAKDQQEVLPALQDASWLFASTAKLWSLKGIY